MKHCWRVFWDTIVSFFELVQRLVELAHAGIDSVEKSLDEPDEKPTAARVVRKRTTKS